MIVFALAFFIQLDQSRHIVKENADGNENCSNSLQFHPSYRENVSVPTHDLSHIRIKTHEPNNGSRVFPIQVGANEVTQNMINSSDHSDGSTLWNGQLEGLECKSEVCTQRLILGLYMSVATYASCFVVIIVILLVFCFKYKSLILNPYSYYKADSSFSRSIT